MSFTPVPGQTVSVAGYPQQMTVETVQPLNGLVVCSFYDPRTGILQRLQLDSGQLSPAASAFPVAGLSPGAVTIPLGPVSLESAAGFQTLWPRQSVVAGLGAIPFTFSPGPTVAGNSYVELVANGISAAPTVSGMTPMSYTGAGTYNNIAGMINGLNVESDGFDVYYQWNSYGNPIPTPVAFTAALNGTALTIAFGGTSLGPITPPLSAFSLAATRSGQRAPYFLTSINSVNSGDTQVVLNIAGGQFQAGDVVQLSYAPPASKPLQDDPTTKGDKVALWLNAAVTVQ